MTGAPESSKTINEDAEGVTGGKITLKYDPK